MRVSGFTFVRNAVRLDYPVVESIRSILPVVDEMVVNVCPFRRSRSAIPAHLDQAFRANAIS
jgi:hypothetical protein